MKMEADIVIAGTGIAGLFNALCLPRDKKIIMISKSDFESNDSFLAQGGICVQKDDYDYDSFFEDTMRAGHYENRKESVDAMIRESREVIYELIKYGVDFDKSEDGQLLYTKEGAHAKPRILFHKDITGKAITSTLLERVQALDNVEMFQFTEMTDIIVEDGVCKGIIAKKENGEELEIRATDTVWATGGIGGRYKHSTNFPHLTGDALTIAEKHGIKLENLDYVQIHPTTLYSKKPGRSFLISESVRGEGALLYDKNMQRFTDELQPRDVVTQAINKQMEKDGTEHVWLSMEKIPDEDILSHFPNIYQRCVEEGYDPLKECIPVVPAQHYFMGGVWVDTEHSRTSMEHLYACGETACNGVHGKNRLASNSLLESIVFARRAAISITKGK